MITKINIFDKTKRFLGLGNQKFKNVNVQPRIKRFSKNLFLVDAYVT